MPAMNYFNKLIDFFKKIEYSSKELEKKLELPYENSSKKEKTLEVMYPNMTDEEIWDAIAKKNEDEWTYEEEDFNLRMILNVEFESGRSKAIKELIHFKYKIKINEFENPFKELINFTLYYFKSHYIEQPIETLTLLENVFPIMNQFIFREITNNRSLINIESDFDYQNAYDEFLIFSKNYYCSKFSDKLIRDKQIKKEFKLTHNGFINFIENGKYD